jgi:hypothetical protein
MMGQPPFILELPSGAKRHFRALVTVNPVNMKMIMNFGHLVRYKIEFRRVFRCRPKRDECLLGVGALLS